MSTRFLIVDDHDVVRCGLRALIAQHPDWKVCGEAADGRTALAMACETNPDIILLDISMPDMNGLTATRKLREILPKAQVLILTQHSSEELIQTVLRAGARGYLLKSNAVEELPAAVAALQQHQPFFTGSVVEKMLKQYVGQATAEERVNPLSPRESEIVQLLAEGKSNKEIATSLNLSVNTVEAHRANIMTKLELHSLSELALYAVRNRIVTP